MESSGKVAIVTGAGTGIGKQAALALLHEGYSVVLAGRRRELLEGTAEEAKSRGLANPGGTTNVGDPASVKSLFAKPKRLLAGSTCYSTMRASAHPAFHLKISLMSSGNR